MCRIHIHVCLVTVAAVVTVTAMHVTRVCCCIGWADTHVSAGERVQRYAGERAHDLDQDCLCERDCACRRCYQLGNVGSGMRGGAPDLDLVDVLVAYRVEVVVVLEVPHLRAGPSRAGSSEAETGGSRP